MYVVVVNKHMKYQEILCTFGPLCKLSKDQMRIVSRKQKTKGWVIEMYHFKHGVNARKISVKYKNFINKALYAAMLDHEGH